MGIPAQVDLEEIYTHISHSARLEEFDVVKRSPSLGIVSFAEIDRQTLGYVLPLIKEMNDLRRLKGRFMLDLTVLGLLRKQKDPHPEATIAFDVHFETLMKTTYRCRYLAALTEFVKFSDARLLLNIKSLPVNLPPPKMCDLLRYLFLIIKNVSLQITQDNILAQDLTRISVKTFVLSVPDLTQINSSQRRDITLQRLSRFPGQDKEIIVRNAPKEVVVEQVEDDAFYL